MDKSLPWINYFKQPTLVFRSQNLEGKKKKVNHNFKKLLTTQKVKT